MISSGTPALVSANANLSPVSGVWGEGFRSTAFPAMIAGRTEFTVTRYGKLCYVSLEILRIVYDLLPWHNYQHNTKGDTLNVPPETRVIRILQ